MVQVDGAESGGPVDPGVACWVGMSGEPEAREERGLSPWQFAVRGATWSSAELGRFDRRLSTLSTRGRFWIHCTQRQSRRSRVPCPITGGSSILFSNRENAINSLIEIDLHKNPLTRPFAPGRVFTRQAEARDLD